MTFSFNLIEEPFIPCVRLDGQTVEYGLADTLLKAPEIADLRDGSPLVTIALHRLLLAILHRCYQGPKKPGSVDLEMAVKSGASTPTESSTPTSRSGRIGLTCSTTYPFFQKGRLLRARSRAGINRLAQELSRGNNAALFDHTTDDPASAPA